MYIIARDLASQQRVNIYLLIWLSGGFPDSAICWSRTIANSRIQRPGDAPEARSDCRILSAQAVANVVEVLCLSAFGANQRLSLLDALANKSEFVRLKRSQMFEKFLFS